MTVHTLERLGRALETYLDGLGCDCDVRLTISWDDFGHVQIEAKHEWSCPADRETVR